MPTYDYVCDACKHEFEAFESIKADPQTVCPSCSASSLRRKIGAGAAVIFKGSGFYQTDYRSDSYKKAAKADSSAPSSSSTTSSTKGEGGSSTTPAAPAASTSSSSSSTPAKPST
jgi:putative FmdB family regulatory protein